MDAKTDVSLLKRGEKTENGTVISHFKLLYNRTQVLLTPV